MRRIVDVRSGRSATYSDRDGAGPIRVLENAMRYIVAVSLALAAVPTDAKVLAIAQSGDGARIVLYDVAGPCVRSAKLAEHISANGDKVQGCWLTASGNVMVSFLDGERGTIPVAHLRPLEDI
jgi:hypothetical protein